jgi:peptidyl-prolyl cis-trans isomerase B (cyclophilin B)
VSAPVPPPPPYGAYPPPYDPYAHPRPRPTNGMAIASLVCAFLFAPLGIIFGHISLSQIRKTGEDGHGLAIAGLVISYLITIGSIFVLLGVMLFAIVFARSVNEHMNELNSRYPSYTAAPSAPGNQLPDFAPPANLGANCAYPATTEPASKPNKPPRSGRVPTDPARVSVSMTTNDGNVGLQLDNGKAPCTVNSFASLAQQGYFDGTTCHRLTTSSELGVLQCGDPSGTGHGGPGYRFANEYPTNQYRLSDPALQNPVVYPRGTVAMANAGSGTNGSQFFLVYADSMLPPTYTAFGKIDATGLATLDKIAAAGVDGGSDDGKPAKTVTIQSVRLD